MFTYDEAKADVDSAGGELISITSSAYQMAVQSLMEDNSVDKAWTGGRLALLAYQKQDFQWIPCKLYDMTIHYGTRVIIK